MLLGLLLQMLNIKLIIICTETGRTVVPPLNNMPGHSRTDKRDLRGILTSCCVLNELHT